MIDTVVSHFKIAKKLGRGGMAEVYEAIDTDTKKSVALKILLPHLASDEIVRQRFLREAKVGMQLDHPGIAKVYEVGKDKQPYIAMELVKGQTLHELIKHKPLPLRQALAIAQKLTDALSAAHKQGIIHRDIKPGNIMIAGDWVKLMDFGLARVIDTTSLTEKHEVLGTLYYMSPEQVIGEAVDARSDIFSLGVVLYQTLTARRPFEGEHAGTVIHAILYSEPVRLCDIDRGLPKEVEQVVFKALQKKDHRRYQSTIDLKSDLLSLDNMLDGKSVSLIASDISTEEVFENQTHRGVYSALIGREQEMDELQKHLTRMLQGRSSAVLLSGEAGIGKSRLVWELGQKAKKQDVRYLIGRCPSSGGLPYQPILEVIRQYFEIKGIGDKKTLNNYITKYARHMSYRKHIIAALALQHTAKDGSIANREQLLDTATEIIKVISRDRPVVIHLDDLHWADAPTLDMLVYIIRNTVEERVFIIGTYRPEDIADEKYSLRSMFKRTRKENLINDVTLNRLDKTSTQNIIKSVFENSDFSDSFIDLIHKETEGNPLFILEVLKLLRDENMIVRHNGGWRSTSETIKVQIPGTVTDVIMRRLEKLSREEREIIDIAAVDGLSFQSDAIAYCLEQPRIKILRRLQDLESSHNIIHATKHGFQFDHGKIRDVVYDSIVTELRREYHRVLGEYLCKHFADKDEHAGKIAQHLLKADEEQKALPYLMKAGDYAGHRWIHIAALEYYREAVKIIDNLLKTAPSSELHTAKLNALKNKIGLGFLLGFNKESIADAKTGWEISKKLGNKQTQTLMISCLGDLYRRVGDVKTSIKYCERAIRLCQKDKDRETITYNLSSISACYWVLGDHKQALLYAKQCLKISREIGDKYNEARNLYNLGMAYCISTQYKTALKYLKLSLKLFSLQHNKQWVAYITENMGWCYIYLRDHRRGERFMKKAIILLRKLDEKHMRDYALIGIGYVHLLRGEYAIALSLFEDTYYKSKGRGEKRLNADLLTSIAHIDFMRGNFTNANEMIRRSMAISKEIGLQRYMSEGYLLLGYIYFFLGEYQRALVAIGECLCIARKFDLRSHQWNAERCQYKIWLDLGDKRRTAYDIDQALRFAQSIRTREMVIASNYDASQLKVLKGNDKGISNAIAKGLRLSRRWNLANSLAEGLSLAANVEVEKGEFNKAKKHAEELLHFAIEKGTKPDQAHAHLRLARVMLHTKNLNKAKEHARSLCSMAQECGMKPLLWQAHYILGKVYLKQKQFARAQQELKKAGKIVKIIASKLVPDNKKNYFKKKEVIDLFKDMRRLKMAEDHEK